MGARLGRAVALLLPYAYVLALAGLVAVLIDATIDDSRGTLTFAEADVLILLLGCALLAWVGFHLHRRRSATFAFSRVEDLRQSGRGFVSWLAPLPRALRLVAVGLIVLALARPQTVAREVVEIEGIDIMLVLDLSKSMSERDLRRNRLDAAQRTIRRFITGRNDRVGLVIFARNAMLQCPLTLDMTALDRIVAELQIGDIDPMGTAIGDGVGLAVASLRRSDARSKVVILLTDGDSNVVNVMNPEEALAAARERDIRIFTVLMGSEAALSGEPGRRSYGTNPTLLKEMAAQSGGRYYHAGDTDALARGFEEVRATLEKSKRREVRRVPTELYVHFALPALVLLLLEVLLSLTRLRRFP
jgi:Ca-activated chloride channel homolog